MHVFNIIIQTYFNRFINIIHNIIYIIIIICTHGKMSVFLSEKIVIFREQLSTSSNKRFRMTYVQQFNKITIILSVKFFFFFFFDYFPRFSKIIKTSKHTVYHSKMKSLNGFGLNCYSVMFPGV